ncbi:hypothetical protein VA599_19880 [Chromobacterium sp. TRC.1.1.SA]|uniref:Uncharacterized protein n=1 Tax=Chromobacterium indicum TaxID=3110228 RepID=A0ABV0CPB0_9NEIS
MNIIEIELPFWQDPQCHIITTHQQDVVSVVFNCWNEDAEIENDYLGCIIFSGVIATNISSKIAPTTPDDLQFKSSIYEIKNSKWIEDYIKNSTKWTHENYDKKHYHHYLVNSHDHQLALICKQYEIRKTSPEKKDLIFDFEFKQ